LPFLGTIRASGASTRPPLPEREVEYRAFQKRSLADRDYVYVWVDGVHFNVRLEDDRLCTLVMIGVRPDGTKELITVEDGYRESRELEDRAPGPEAPRHAPARYRRGRRCPWVLGGDAGRVAEDP